MDAYSELQAKARDVPQQDLKVDFGRVTMARLGKDGVGFQLSGFETVAPVTPGGFTWVP